MAKAAAFETESLGNLRHCCCDKPVPLVNMFLGPFVRVGRWKYANTCTLLTKVKEC